MNSTVLELNSLVKEFDGKKAVNNISFSLKKGEILGLLGPNGAGKSTTIRMIMNIIAPDSGSVSILGGKFTEQTKNLIGYLPEERGLYRKLKVTEILSFFGELKSMKKDSIKQRSRELLEKFDLWQHRDKKVEELSKGMAQKLQIITTILHSPELLILDEPFSGLDPVNIEMVKDLILAMKKEGITIIFSTHLMDYAEKIVDSVVMINSGQKVLDGRLSEVKNLYGEKNIKISYDGDSDFIKELGYVKNFRDYGNEMEIELNSIGEKSRLIQDLNSKLSINSLKINEVSLNNIFMLKAKNSGDSDNEN